MKRIPVLLLSFLFAASASAAGLGVTGAWIRHLPAGVPAGGFFTVHNPDKQAVALVGASSPAFGMVMMHRTVEEGGVSKMVAVTRVEVPAGGILTFGPGGYHLMLMHPTRDVAVGTKVPVTLKLSDGRELTVRFDVLGPAARGPAGRPAR